jgi:hypothetical protein
MASRILFLRKSHLRFQSKPEELTTEEEEEPKSERSEMNASKVENEPTLLLYGRRVPAKDYEVLKVLVNAFAGETRPRTPVHNARTAALAFAIRVLAEWRTKRL